MRKLLLVAALAVFSVCVSAQGLKGTWFAGGSLNLGSTPVFDDEGNEFKLDTYSVLPLVGTFVSPSVAVGGALGYTHAKSGELKANTITVMPLARKYWNISGGLYFFGQAALPVAFGDEKAGDYKVNGLDVYVQLSPGFDLIVNNWLTVEASFLLVNAGYSSSKPKGGETSDSWLISGNTIGSSKFGDLSVGVKFLF
jgi:hypothetical protein